MPLRITTWNVNGIRNPFSYQPWRENRTFQAMFDTLEADIVVMQETKIQRKDLRDDMVLVPGWDVFFSLPKYKKGYSGVVIYTRNSKCCPIRAEEGITGVLCPPNSSTKYRDLPPDQQIGGYPLPEQLSDSIDEQTLDSEGRCVILEFPAFVLIGVYSPATRDESRTEFREAFIDAMDARVRNLVAMGKQVFLCGDLNIIRDELDAAGLQERLRKEGMTLEEFLSMHSRRFLNQLVFGGRVIGERDQGREQPVLWDLCREFHPTRTGMYTCWETRKNARPGNFGNRIDYVLCSSGIKDWFFDSNIQEGLLGSDHCPVYATIADTVNLGGSQVHIEDIMNPPGMFKDGVRQREWCQKDLLPLSAKLIPEFDRRQSIKDMFFRKASTSGKPTSSANATSTQSTPTDMVPSGGCDESQKESPASVSQSLEQPTSTPTLPSTAPNNITTVPAQKPIGQKRQATPSTSPNRPQKKGKVALSRESSSKTASGFSQSSLKGFLKPKTPTPDIKTASEAGSAANPAIISDPNPEGPEPKQDTPTSQESSSQNTQNSTGGSVGESSRTEGSFTDKVFDPIQAKESWSKLLGKRVVPKCEHGEDCQMLVTKKPGVNCGHSSYAPVHWAPLERKNKGRSFVAVLSFGAVTGMVGNDGVEGEKASYGTFLNLTFAPR